MVVGFGELGLLRGLGVGSRPDPFYVGLFGDGWRHVWADYRQCVVADGLGLLRLREGFRVDGGVLPRLLAGVCRGRVVEVLGLVVGWRTLSVGQVCGFTGLSERVVWRVVLGLWGFGLVELGFACNGLDLCRVRGLVLVRPRRDEKAWGDLRWLLSYEEWLGVSFGGAVGGGHYDRHNVLMTELALRVWSYCGGVSLVLGEPLASMDLLFGSGLGRCPRLDGRGVPVVDGRRADGVFVRGDGLRVVVELTTRDSPSLSVKLRRWLRYLGANSLEKSGVVLLLVGASGVEGEGVRVRHHVGGLFGGFPDWCWRGRVFWVDWVDWFPGVGRVSEGFLSGSVLGADSRYGWGERVDLWRLAGGGLGFVPDRGFDAQAVLRNLGAV